MSKIACVWIEDNTIISNIQKLVVTEVVCTDALFELDFLPLWMKNYNKTIDYWFYVIDYVRAVTCQINIQHITNSDSQDFTCGVSESSVYIEFIWKLSDNLQV